MDQIGPNRSKVDIMDRIGQSGQNGPNRTNMDRIGPNKANVD